MLETICRVVDTFPTAIDPCKILFGVIRGRGMCVVTHSHFCFLFMDTCPDVLIVGLVKFALAGKRETNQQDDAYSHGLFSLA